MDRPRRRGLRRLHRAPRPRRHRRREPDPVRGARRRRPRRTCWSRPPTRPGRPTTRTAATACTRAPSPCPPGNPHAYKAAFSVSYNRPFDGTITAGQRALVPVLRRVPDDPVPRAQRLRRELHEPGRRRRRRRRSCSTTRSSSPAATTSTGPGRERANVEAARDAGVSLAFFSGNEVFWKTRWQSSSADGTATPNRTLTTYKDTHFDARRPIRRPGPAPGATRASAPPADGGRPENALTGQLFIVNSGSSRHHGARRTYKNLRLWRNTAVANLGAGQSRTLGAGSRRSATSGTSTPTTASARAARSSLSSTTVSRRRVVHRLRQRRPAAARRRRTT